MDGYFYCFYSWGLGSIQKFDYIEYSGYYYGQGWFECQFFCFVKVVYDSIIALGQELIGLFYVIEGIEEEDYDDVRFKVGVGC